MKNGTYTLTKAEHGVSTIDSSNFYELGQVTNTVQLAVNNGVIVRLDNGSAWTVTGTSHLTRLTIAADATVRAANGKSLTMARRRLSRRAAPTPARSSSRSAEQPGRPMPMPGGR